MVLFRTGIFMSEWGNMSFSGAWHGETGACMGLILHAGIKNFSRYFSGGPKICYALMVESINKWVIPLVNSEFFSCIQLFI